MTLTETVQEYAGEPTTPLESMVVYAAKYSGVENGDPTVDIRNHDGYGPYKGKVVVSNSRDAHAKWRSNGIRDRLLNAPHSIDELHVLVVTYQEENFPESLYLVVPVEGPPRRFKRRRRPRY